MIVLDQHITSTLSWTVPSADDPGIRDFRARRGRFLNNLLSANIGFSCLDVFLVRDRRDGSSRPTAYVGISPSAKDSVDTVKDICTEHQKQLKIDIRIQFLGLYPFFQAWRFIDLVDEREE